MGIVTGVKPWFWLWKESWIGGRGISDVASHLRIVILRVNEDKELA